MWHITTSLSLPWGAFLLCFPFLFLFLFICEGTYFLSGLMTFRNQIGNENVMSAYLGEEMYKESSSTDDGKRGQICGKFNAILSFARRKVKLGKFVQNAVLVPLWLTVICLHAGFLQKAKMALWFARHNNKSKLFLQAEILDDFISSALSLSGCWGLGSSLILKGRCLVAAQNPHILKWMV